MGWLCFVFTHTFTPMHTNHTLPAVHARASSMSRYWLLQHAEARTLYVVQPNMTRYASPLHLIYYFVIVLVMFLGTIFWWCLKVMSVGTDAYMSICFSCVHQQYGNGWHEFILMYGVPDSYWHRIHIPAYFQYGENIVHFQHSSRNLCFGSPALNCVKFVNFLFTTLCHHHVCV